MGQLRTYNASEVSVIIGSRPASGFGEASFVSVERDEDSFTKQVGADGEVTRAKTNNNAGRITLTLQQAAEFNEFLSTLLTTDELTDAGSFPVIIRDASGNTLVICESAWILKPPVVDFARDAGEREWVIDCADMQVFAGSN